MVLWEVYSEAGFPATWQTLQNFSDQGLLVPVPPPQPPCPRTRVDPRPQSPPTPPTILEHRGVEGIEVGVGPVLACFSMLSSMQWMAWKIDEWKSLR